MLIQTLQSESGIERLYERIVRRLARPREVQLHLIPVGPAIKVPGDKLRAVVYPDRSRNSVLLNYSFQNTNHIHASNSLAHMKSQALTGVIVH